jgi:hypothetical protein
LFNIAIDTAQRYCLSIINYTAKRSIICCYWSIRSGSNGLVASQKVPQYFDGTDNHTGGLMLVDGKGLIIERLFCQTVKEIMPQKVEMF